MPPDTLYQATHSGRLRIILIVGPPRSMSTAIAISLTQSPDVAFCIHEPFADNYQKPRNTTAGIKVIKKLIAKTELHNNQNTIIIKDCCNHLNQHSFKILTKFCDNIIFLIRSPLRQLQSIVKICKWIWSNQPENFNFNLQQLTKKDIKKFAKNGDLETYFINSWKRIERQINSLKNTNKHNINWFTVDTEMICAQQKLILEQITNKLNIRFSDKMIANWDQKKIYQIKKDAWAQKAAHARGLHLPEKTYPKLEDFPQSWQNKIETSTRIYAKLLTENFLKPKSSTALQNLCKQSSIVLKNNI